MKVVFFGTPEFAVPTLERLLASSHQVVLVVSRPDKPVGRRQVLTAPPVIELASKRGKPCFQPEKLKNQECADRLAETGADAAVVVAFGRLLPEALLAIPPHGFINLHPSMLPRHRGPSPIQWALVCGDQRTGVSTMQLDAGMDTGPLLLQREVLIEPGETAAQLSPRLAELGADLIVETLDQIEAGKLKPQAQSQQGVTVTPMLKRSMAKVDWTCAASELVNRFRGFTPWPGLHTNLRGGRLKIFGLEEVTPAPAGDEEPGTVTNADSEGIVVRCGQGTAVRITELQREGRRRLPVDAFLVGERICPGEHLS
jgi:methionyl-tRNA formyltransferase